RAAVELLLACGEVVGEHDVLGVAALPADGQVVRTGPDPDHLAVGTRGHDDRDRMVGPACGAYCCGDAPVVTGAVQGDAHGARNVLGAQQRTRAAGDQARHLFHRVGRVLVVLERLDSAATRVPPSAHVLELVVPGLDPRVRVFLHQRVLGVAVDAGLHQQL